MMLDSRYEHVKSIWKAGDLNSFSEIFSIIPKTIVCKDLRLNYAPFTKKLKKLELFTFHDILHLSLLIGADFKDIARLLLLEIEEKAKHNSLTK